MSVNMILCHVPHVDSLSLLWTQLSHMFSIYSLRTWLSSFFFFLGGFNSLSERFS